MEKIVSPYYPPRARWYRRFRYSGFAARKALRLDRLLSPHAATWLRFVLSLVVPGYAFLALGRRILGRALMAAYGAAALLFIVGLGYRAGSFGLSLMISIHAISLVYLETHRLRDDCRFGFRLVLALATPLILALAVYWPAIGYVGKHWLMPFRVGDRVILVSRSSLPQSLKRGDLAVYRVSGGGTPGLRVREGLAADPVLALGGDRVVFGAGQFKVNGVAYASLPYMPAAGEWVVPENHWFVWPTLAISGWNREVNESTVSDILMRTADVSLDKYIGRPCRWWFWRRQTQQH